MRSSTSVATPDSCTQHTATHYLTVRQARTGAHICSLPLRRLCTHYLAATACWKVLTSLLTTCLRETFLHFTATLILRYTCHRRRSIFTSPPHTHTLQCMPRERHHLDSRKVWEKTEDCLSVPNGWHCNDDMCCAAACSVTSTTAHM